MEGGNCHILNPLGVAKSDNDDNDKSNQMTLFEYCILYGNVTAMHYLLDGGAGESLQHDHCNQWSI